MEKGMRGRFVKEREKMGRQFVEAGEDGKHESVRKLFQCNVTNRRLLHQPGCLGCSILAFRFTS